MIFNIILAFCYLTIVLWIILRERIDIINYGADALTIVKLFALVYLLVPAVFIYAILGVYGSSVKTGNPLFDSVYYKLSHVDSLFVLLLTVLFLWALFFTCKNARGLTSPRLALRQIVFKRRAAYLIIIAGFFLILSFFWGLGSSTEERYAKLILFRNNSDLIEKNFISANAFSLTLTFSWLASVMFFCEIKRRRHQSAFFILILLLMFCVGSGSRRGFIFPIAIIYLSVFLYGGRVYFLRMIPVFILGIFWVAYGKELTGSISYGVDVDDAINSDANAIGIVLKTLSDVAIPFVESLATFQHLDQFSYPRFGFDHALSVIRKIPDGMLGLDIDWPDRIIRNSTEIFLSRDEADVPPGLIGQSWLDFPVFGAVIWGLIIGLQVRILNSWAKKFKNSPEKFAVIVLLSLIISLPINSGSYDYVFSIDIMALALFMIFIFRSKFV